MSSHVERYEQMLWWLRSFSTFHSEEQARSKISEQCKQGDHAHFVVARDNAYDVHRGYWNREEFVSQRDFTISLHDLDTAKHAAVVELGERELGKLLLNH